MAAMPGTQNVDPCLIYRLTPSFLKIYVEFFCFSLSTSSAKSLRVNFSGVYRRVALDMIQGDLLRTL